MDDTKDDREPRLVKQQEFFDMLNEAVFLPQLGRRLDFDECKDIVHGVCDTITAITLRGDSVRLGRLGTFKSHTSPSTNCYNPVRSEMMVVSERRRLAFKQSKSTKRLFAVSSGDDDVTAD